MWKSLSIAILTLGLSSGAALASEGADIKAGEKLYKAACFACHGTGVANAPKLGDKKAWVPLIEQGRAEMLRVTVNGKGAMPPRGGTRADDAALSNALEFMLSKVE